MLRPHLFPVLALLATFTPGLAAGQDVSCPQQMTYLSDTSSAYRHLEDRQRAIYAAHPALTDPFSREALNRPESVKTSEEIADRLARQGCDANGENCVGDAALYRRLMEARRCLPLPTRFESPAFFQLLTLYVTELERLRQRDYPAAKAPQFGTLPTGVLDAQALIPPGATDPLVIINRDLFFFTGALSKSVSNAIPIGVENGRVAISFEPSAIALRLSEEPQIVANFAEAMAGLVATGTSRGATEMFLDADHNRLHARLLGAMDFYLVAHEQAHVILNHVRGSTVAFNLLGTVPPGGARTVPNPPAASPATLSVLARTQAQELEADALGFRLLMSSAASREPVSALIAPAAAHVVFRIIDAVDRYRLALNNARIGDGGHPTAAERVRNVDRVHAELSGSTRGSDIDFRPVFDASLEALLRAAEPAIRQKLGLPAL